MAKPEHAPIGRELTRIAKEVARAFDDELSAADGSLPQWLILISLKGRPMASQRELADAVGIQGATLTAHLDAMEFGGLLTRRRDPANRRVHIVELTDDGELAFRRLRGAAASFDRQLRNGLSDGELATLRHLLARLHHNVVAAQNLI